MAGCEVVRVLCGDRVPYMIGISLTITIHAVYDSPSLFLYVVLVLRSRTGPVEGKWKAVKSCGSFLRIDNL